MTEMQKDFEECYGVRVSNNMRQYDETAWLAWQTAWYAAICTAVAEWEKPYGLADGKTFITRLRDL